MLWPYALEDARGASQQQDEEEASVVHRRGDGVRSRAGAVLMQRLLNCTEMSSSRQKRTAVGSLSINELIEGIGCDNGSRSRAFAYLFKLQPCQQ